MNAEWKAFLIEKGAVFDADTLESFNTSESIPKLPERATLSSLSKGGLIKVTGEDAESFLQNQLSNDIRNVSDTTYQISAWCSPKGRIISTFTLFKKADSFFLSLSSDLLEPIIKKLRMYVMMSKVTIEDVSDTMIHFGYAGEQAAETLKKILENSDSALPTEATQTTAYKTLSILRLASNIPRFEFFGDIEDAKEIWDACSSDSTLDDGKTWMYLDILAGIPVITEESSEAWIPQMVNYTIIGGVDFKKGCYPGQEVVARLNYLGKTKRRMYRIQINTNDLPATNDAISSNPDQLAGKILSVATNPKGVIEALAVLKISEAEKPLKLANNEEATITLLDLPYSVSDG